MERRIASGMEGYSKRKSPKKRGFISLVASQTGSAIFSPPCGARTIHPNLPTLYPAAPQVVGTCCPYRPCKTASSHSRNFALRFSHCNSSFRFECPMAGAALSAAPARACSSSSICCLLATLVATCPLVYPILTGLLRFFFSFFPFVFIFSKYVFLPATKISYSFERWWQWRGLR